MVLVSQPGPVRHVYAVRQATDCACHLTLPTPARPGGRAGHAPGRTVGRAMHEHDVRAVGVSVSEAARILRVSTGTIRRRIAEGTLKAERVIRPQGAAWRVH